MHAFVVQKKTQKKPFSKYRQILVGVRDKDELWLFWQGMGDYLTKLIGNSLSVNNLNFGNTSLSFNRSSSGLKYFEEQVAFLEIQSIVLKLIFQVLKKCIKTLSIGRRNPLVQSNNFNGENNGLSSA